MQPKNKKIQTQGPTGRFFLTMPIEEVARLQQFWYNSRLTFRRSP